MNFLNSPMKQLTHLFCPLNAIFRWVNTTNTTRDALIFAKSRKYWASCLREYSGDKHPDYSTWLNAYFSDHRSASKPSRSTLSSWPIDRNGRAYRWNNLHFVYIHWSRSVIISWTSSPAFTGSLGVPIIRFAQKHGATNLLNLSTVATLFSAVTATTMQFSYQLGEENLAISVNCFWFASLVFSIAAAVNSLLGLTWKQAM